MVRISDSPTTVCSTGYEKHKRRYETVFRITIYSNGTLDDSDRFSLPSFAQCDGFTELASEYLTIF